MRRVLFIGLATAGVALFVGGCASTRDRGSATVDGLLKSRGAVAVTWPGPDAGSSEADTRLIAEKSREPITARRAVEIAFLRSPAIRQTYAELGITQAQVIEASELPTPTFGYARLAAEGNGGTQITRSVSISFTDLLFLPARARNARIDAQAGRERAAASLLRLQLDVEAAWYEYVAALQSSRMRDAAARAAEASGEYARRVHAAGNLPPKVLALQTAAATEARIAAARARAEAIRARARLASLMGLSTRDPWQVTQSLPALPAQSQAPAGLANAASDSRLDLVAKRREVAALESILRLARWWRWLGDVEVGYERETEIEGTRIHGPTFSFGIPLLSWNRAGVLRARAGLERARAGLRQLEVEVGNEISLGIDQLTSARDIADAYRLALLPQREAVSARTFEEVNFMLSGAFEALDARRQQFDAYGDYIDAVRDYWLARVELRRATGGALPDDEATASSAILELEEPDVQAGSGSQGEHR